MTSWRPSSARCWASPLLPATCPALCGTAGASAANCEQEEGGGRGTCVVCESALLSFLGAQKDEEEEEEEEEQKREDDVAVSGCCLKSTGYSGR